MEPRHANSRSSARRLCPRASSSAPTGPVGLCGPAPTTTRGSERAGTALKGWPGLSLFQQSTLKNNELRPLSHSKRGVSGNKEEVMKYICLGSLEPGKFEGMTEDERHAVLDECFEHNDLLRANGHLAAEIGLQPPETAVTLYWKNGKVATTDGPYAETKEQLGGIQILEARDLNHAVQLVSQLPGFKFGLGPVEIRPMMDLSEIIEESERRRRKDTSR